MRGTALVLAAVVIGCGIVAHLGSSSPRGQALADDMQVSMPKEAVGFNGTLLGQVVKPVANGCFTIKVVKVVGVSPANKTKLNPAGLTDAWKDKFDWCGPAKDAAALPQLNVGDMVVMVCFQNEMHLRYTKVSKQEGATTSPANAGPMETKVVKDANGLQLQRDGKPYFIKGGGGGGSKPLLAKCGGNSFRTWGVGKETQAELDEAQKLGLTVTVGIWLGHKDNGFSWSNKEAVKKQFDGAKEAITKYKDHPALLIWALGNEMESGANTPEVWQGVEELAKMAHQTDPKHPTMTVVAEIGGKTLEYIKEYCPDIDIVGINSYGGGPTVGQRFRKAQVGKPFIITEFGPAGTWEIGRNTFGAPNELTSTDKAKSYRNVYEKSVLGEPNLCLGSYAFTWGFKREATATWYGLFLPDGSRLAGVDALTELWSGKKPEHPCPQMTHLAIVGTDQVPAGQTLKATVEANDPSGDKIEIHWAMFKEMSNYGVTGTGANATADLSSCIVANGQKAVTIKAPAEPGIYRIYCYVHNAHESAAVGSLPIKVLKNGDSK